MASKVELPLEEIKKRYLDGETLKSIGHSYNVNRVTIKNRLVEMGVELRPFIKKQPSECKNCGKVILKAPWEIERVKNVFCSQGCAFKFNRKYDYDENYFEVIDDHLKAYFLGFIIGDGNLLFDKSKRQYQLRFGINQRDKEVLDTLIEQIRGDPNQIKKIKNNQSWLAINNKKMVNDLINLGVPYKDKSYVAEPLDIPKEFESSFWLGLFDADGSAVWNNYGRHRSLALSLIGTEKICKGFSKFLGYGGKGVYKHKGVYSLNITISDSKGINYIFNKLYKDAKFCLSRKKMKFKEIIKNRIEYENSL